VIALQAAEGAAGTLDAELAHSAAVDCGRKRRTRCPSNGSSGQSGDALDCRRRAEIDRGISIRALSDIASIARWRQHNFVKWARI
jgi:hypothetical protein